MPRGKRKVGEFDFTIWFEDGSRVQWKSTRKQSNAEIAAAVRRYLFPVAHRYGPQTVIADVIAAETVNRLMDRRALCSRPEVIAAYDFAIGVIRDMFGSR